MASFRFLQRLHARDGASTRPSSRTEVVPPSLRQAPEGWTQRLWFWLMAPAPLQASPPSNRLPPVRQEFLDALGDLPLNEPVLALNERIAKARSLRDLWHLRTEVFHLVSLHHSQGEADFRLLHLNRHFPTRTPRSGFTPL